MADEPAVNKSGQKAEKETTSAPTIEPQIPAQPATPEAQPGSAITPPTVWTKLKAIGGPPWRIGRAILKYGAVCGFLIVFGVVGYNMFFQRTPFAPPDPEALGKAWDDTVAQFGIAPVFPPREDVQVGDLYAVLGERAGEHRPVLMYQRAIKLDHLGDVDERLSEIFKNVLVLPENPAGPPKDGTIIQTQCPQTCLTFTTRTSLPLIILPGINSSQARQKALQAGYFSKMAHSLFGGSADQAQAISISIPYAEIYGLSSLEASGLLQKYCSDDRGRAICSEDSVRQQLAMVAGDLPWKRVPDSDRYQYPVYLVLVSAAYLTRSINYGFSTDSAAGIKAQVYQTLESKLKADAQNPPPPAAPATIGTTSPAPSGGADPGTIAVAQQAAEAERQRLTRIVADAAGLPSGGSLSMETSTSDRVVINQTLPRPVTIGFIPVMKDFRLAKGKQTVVDPPDGS